jgi:hypothetical protein
MLNSKTLLTYLLTLMVGFMMTACPDECAEDTAGAEAGSEEEAAAGAEDACADEGGETAGGETAGGETAGGDAAGAEPVVTYNQVVVVDTTTDINDDGTPGVDICEVDIACDGAPVGMIDDIKQDFGDSPSCNADNGDNCVCDGTEMRGVCTSGTDRANKQLTFDNDASCEGNNYSSVGISGYLSYVSSSFADCGTIDVTVTERDGNNDESYIVALCGDIANININEMMFGDVCAVLGSAATSGTSNFSWSAE